MNHKTAFISPPVSDEFRLIFKKGRIILLFLIISLVVSNNIYDFKEGEKISTLFYFPQILIAILWFLPKSLKRNPQSKTDKSKLFFELFLILSFIISIIRLDITGIKILISDFVLFYCILYGTGNIKFSLKHINIIFIVQICIGAITTFIDINKLSFLPYFLNSGVYPWQVSIFPLASTPYTGALAGIVFIANFLNNKRHYSIILISFFYMILAGSRTIYIGVFLGLLPYFLSKVWPNIKPARLLLISYIILVLIVSSPFWTTFFQQIDIPIINEMFFRNFQTSQSITPEDIDRVIISKAYINAFLQNPIFGLGGDIDFPHFVSVSTAKLVSTGTETRLLYLFAAYGISFVFYLVFLIRLQLNSISKKQYMITGLIFLYIVILMFYGSFMRGYMLNCFLIYLIISIHTKNTAHDSEIIHSDI